MPRHLTWKRDAEAASADNAARGTESSTPNSSCSTRRSRRPAIDSDPVRTPSTSPPPERPEEEFMIPGALHDDRYRMVEDEFLAVAQRFTAHLHRAEYDRLKAVARSRNAAAISEMEGPQAGATGLQGLMNAPGRAVDALDVLPRAARASGRTGTRAAAGSARETPALRSRGGDAEEKRRVRVPDGGAGEGNDDYDDPFGMNARRLERKRSREQTRKSEVRETPPKKTRVDMDAIPSFL